MMVKFVLLIIQKRWYQAVFYIQLLSLHYASSHPTMKKDRTSLLPRLMILLLNSLNSLYARAAWILTTPPSTSTSKPLASLHLHNAPVSSVSSNSTGSHLLTSSWDGLIGFWDTSIPSSDEVQEPLPNERDHKKRRKLEGSDKPRRKAPLSVLKSHTARVSKVLFAPAGNTSKAENNGEKKKAYSCGFDSTVRFWDTEYGVCDHTIVILLSSSILSFQTF
jgi:ribosome biogenesis protein